MRNKSLISFICISVLLLWVTAPIFADNVEDLLASIIQSYKAKKYSKSLEDLDWVKKEISNLHLQVIKTFLPATIQGYQSKDGDGGSMFGMQSVSREYTKSDSDSIKISIMGGQGSEGSGLGAIMGMASSLGAIDANSQSEMIIVKGQKGRFNLDSTSTPKHGTLTITLQKNTVITIETFGSATSEQAKKAAEMMDFEGIEKAYQ
jgi:hypothetical protein